MQLLVMLTTDFTDAVTDSNGLTNMLGKTVQTDKMKVAVIQTDAIII